MSEYVIFICMLLPSLAYLKQKERLILYHMQGSPWLFLLRGPRTPQCNSKRSWDPRINIPKGPNTHSFLMFVAVMYPLLFIFSFSFIKDIQEELVTCQTDIEKHMNTKQMRCRLAKIYRIPGPIHFNFRCDLGSRFKNI